MKIATSYILLLGFLTSFVSATCSSGQIDINAATISELDKLTGIGPAYAQAIIDSRPFSNLNELVEVKGIGPATLDKIKTQNLACVEDETETLREQDTSNQEETSEEIKKVKITTNSDFIPPEEEQKPSESIINLNNAQQEETIVYESKGEKINKHLLTGFCIFLIGIIFLLIRK